MWLLLARAPVPDAQVWPGRPVLALFDAVLWPLGWAALALGLPGSGGLAGRCVVAWCALSAVQRAYRAVAQNERYHFTTWRWGRWLAIVLAFGYALKLAVLISA